MPHEGRVLWTQSRERLRENNVIWRVRFRGQRLYVYLLIEFQSTVDRFMALRLMVYVGLLYQRLIVEKRISRGDFLPPVLPIVLYNGTDRWPAPLDVAELVVECPDELARYRPQMRYFLLDEHAEDADELAGMKNLAALVFWFEQCRTKEDFERVIDAIGQWRATPEYGESLKRLARWVEMVLTQGQLSSQSVMELEDIQECGTMLKEQVKLWEKELIEKGIEKGRAEGEAEFVVQLLEDKFGATAADYRPRIDAASSEQLLVWAKRIRTADKIEDVFEA